MFVTRLEDCNEFIAADGSALRELLHADKGSYKFRYSLAHAVVRSGNITKPHSLKTTEVYYILEGTGCMYIDGEHQVVSKGMAVYIPPKSVQYIKNIGTGDLVFLCIVDPAWKKEDEEIGR